MKNINSKDLKTILISKRANIYYLEHCRILVNSGRVEYVTTEGSRSLYWNIPIANTSVILLGTGTSVTQAAMRELSKAGVMLGFCGGGGTPLFSGVENDFDINWLSSKSEYRSTEYLQRWLPIWMDEEKRLKAAKTLQLIRINTIQEIWEKGQFSKDLITLIDDDVLNQLRTFSYEIKKSEDTQKILLAEARFTKSIYRIIAERYQYGDFSRVKQGKGVDPANRFLDHGNYLAYGLGAVSTWVLGLPHALSVLHGKTRRGGLVFDAADLIKDAMVMPQAFASALQGDEEREFRRQCISNFTKFEAIDRIIESFKVILSEIGEVK